MCLRTIDRSGTTAKYRVVAYGDSIYAGYYGSVSRVAKRAAPAVDGEYLSQLWNADIEIVRRTKSVGAVASDIYNNKIVAERSYMQTADTRVVTFEMCGNDFLQARSSFKGQSGACNFAPIETALANCTTYQERAMQYINANAHANPKLKVISNIYYPGYNADNVTGSCTINGVAVNYRNEFLPYVAKSNWRACNFARLNGFQCADSFAEYIAADFDTNADGQVDSDAIKFAAVAAIGSHYIAGQAFRVQAHRHILCADHISLGDADMLLAILVVLKSHNVEIAKAGGQLGHCHDAHTDPVPPQSFSFMIGFRCQKGIELLMHGCCHMSSLRLQPCEGFNILYWLMEKDLRKAYP